MPIGTKDAYEGVTGQVWGSHVYYESTAAAYREHGIQSRPIALSRDNKLIEDTRLTPLQGGRSASSAAVRVMLHLHTTGKSSSPDLATCVSNSCK